MSTTAELVNESVKVNAKSTDCDACRLIRPDWPPSAMPFFATLYGTYVELFVITRSTLLPVAGSVPMLAKWRFRGSDVLLKPPRFE